MGVAWMEEISDEFYLHKLMGACKNGRNWDIQI